jgi:TPR repeat protein
MSQPSISGRHVARWQALATLRALRISTALIAAILLAGIHTAAAAASLQRGLAACSRADYRTAASILVTHAERGNRNAQACVGYLYLRGYGLPQNYSAAAHWFLRAAEQGHSGAQYMIGMLYDRGQGVPKDLVESHKWLTLATAGSGRGAREYRARIRAAVATKMLRGEIAESRLRSLYWVPYRE